MGTYLDVLLGVFEVLEESVFFPDYTTLLVGSGVRVPVGLPRLTAKKTVQIRSLLVCSSLFNSVALRALGFEDLGSLLLVTFLSHDSVCCFTKYYSTSCVVHVANAVRKADGYWWFRFLRLVGDETFGLKYPIDRFTGWAASSSSSFPRCRRVSMGPPSWTNQISLARIRHSNPTASSVFIGQFLLLTYFIFHRLFRLHT